MRSHPVSGTGRRLRCASAVAVVHGHPPDGWRLGDTDGLGRLVRSGSAVVHTVQVSDGTWFVDSGDCG